MPLTRDRITIASRIMLPRYAIFFAVVGGVWLGQNLDDLRHTPGLRYVDDLVSLRAWGILFLGSALLMLVAYVWKHSRDMYKYALIICGALLFIWAALLVLAAIFGEASWSAWAWPWIVGEACRATYRSLTKREV